MLFIAVCSTLKPHLARDGSLHHIDGNLEMHSRDRVRWVLAVDLRKGDQLLAKRAQHVINGFLQQITLMLTLFVVGSTVGRTSILAWTPLSRQGRLTIAPCSNSVARFPGCVFPKKISPETILPLSIETSGEMWILVPLEVVVHPFHRERTY